MRYLELMSKVDLVLIVTATYWKPQTCGVPWRVLVATGLARRHSGCWRAAGHVGRDSDVLLVALAGLRVAQ